MLSSLLPGTPQAAGGGAEPPSLAAVAGSPPMTPMVVNCPAPASGTRGGCWPA